MGQKLPLNIKGLCSVIQREKKNGYFVVEFMQNGNGRFSCRVIYQESINISSMQNLQRQLGLIRVILNYLIQRRRQFQMTILELSSNTPLGGSILQASSSSSLDILLKSGKQLESEYFQKSGRFDLYSPGFVNIMGRDKGSYNLIGECYADDDFSSLKFDVKTAGLLYGVFENWPLTTSINKTQINIQYDRRIILNELL